jgi:hypothetical protein
MMMKEEYDEEALVREVIAENPEEERGAREEWAQQVGWHRKENIFLGRQPLHIRREPNKDISYLRKRRKEGKQLLNQLHEESTIIGKENNLHEELEDRDTSNRHSLSNKENATVSASESIFSMSMIAVIVITFFILVAFIKNSRKRQRALRKRHYSF